MSGWFFIQYLMFMEVSKDVAFTISMNSLSEAACFLLQFWASTTTYFAPNLTIPYSSGKKVDATFVAKFH